MERGHVASVDRDVDARECALTGSSREVLRRGLAATGRLVAPVSQEVSHIAAHLLLANERSRHIEREPARKPRRRNELAQGPGKLGDESANAKERMRLDCQLKITIHLTIDSDVGTVPHDPRIEGRLPQMAYSFARRPVTLRRAALASLLVLLAGAVPTGACAAGNATESAQPTSSGNGAGGSSGGSSLSLAITSPDANAEIRGDANFQVDVQNLPADGTIEYVADGKPISGAMRVGSVDPTFTFTLHSVYDAPDGRIALKAIARDASGAIIGQSPERFIYVMNAMTEKFEVVTPNGSIISGISKIQFRGQRYESVVHAPAATLAGTQTDIYIDGELIGSNNPASDPSVIQKDPMEFTIDTKKFRDGNHIITLNTHGFDYCTCGKAEKLGVAHIDVEFQNPTTYVDLEPQWSEFWLRPGQTKTFGTVDAIFGDGTRLTIPVAGQTLVNEDFLTPGKYSWHFRNAAKATIDNGMLTLEGTGIDGPNIAWLDQLDSEGRLLSLVNQVEATVWVDGGAEMYSNVLGQSGGITFAAQPDFLDGAHYMTYTKIDAANKGIRLTQMEPKVYANGPTYTSNFMAGSNFETATWFHEKVNFSRGVVQLDYAAPVYGKYWLDGQTEPAGWSRFRKDNQGPQFDSYRPPAFTKEWVSGVFASGRSKFSNIKFVAKPNFFINDVTVATVDANGNITALGKGETELTVELGIHRRVVRIIVDNTVGLSHYSKTGDVLTTYDPAKSFIPRTLFGLNSIVSSEFKMAGKLGLLKAAGINSTHEGIPVDAASYPDTPAGGTAFCQAINASFTSLTTKLSSLGMYTWMEGDGLLWSGAILTRSWASQGLTCVMTAMKASGRAFNMTVVDEVRNRYVDNPTYHIVSTAFAATPGGHIPWDWHTFFTTQPNDAATWSTPGAAEGFAPEWYYGSELFYGNMIDVAGGMNALARRHSPAMKVQTGNTFPRNTLVSVLGDWWTPIVKGENNHKQEGVLENHVLSVPAIMWNAINQGNVALRMYAMGPKGYSSYEKYDTTSVDVQAPIHPVTWRTHVWQAMGSASTLIGLLEEDILQQPISAVAVGRSSQRIPEYRQFIRREDSSISSESMTQNFGNVMTSARQGAHSRLLIGVNLNDNSETALFNLQPYLYSGGATIRYRQFGASVQSEILASDNYDGITLRQGEVVIYKFTDSATRMPPAVKILTPIADTVLSGKVKVSIDVQAPNGISKIEYLVEEDKFSEEAGEYMQAILDTSTIQPDQWHALIVRVTDNAGHVNQARMGFKRPQSKFTGQWLVDNRHAGYSEHGASGAFGAGVTTWNVFHSYLSDFRFVLFGGGASHDNYAQWEVPNLVPDTYKVYATFGEPWVVSADNAVYEVFDGTTSLGTVQINQAMSGWLKTWDPVNKAQGWEPLGSFPVKSGTLRVRLYQPLTNYRVSADAILVRLEAR